MRERGEERREDGGHFSVGRVFRAASLHIQVYVNVENTVKSERRVYASSGFTIAIRKSEAAIIRKGESKYRNVLHSDSNPTCLSNSLSEKKPIKIDNIVACLVQCLLAFSSQVDRRVSAAIRPYQSIRVGKLCSNAGIDKVALLPFLSCHRSSRSSRLPWIRRFDVCTVYRYM